ncbi:MAG: histidinol dehydrogenase [Flavobacteriaceae bacterium]|nr:histidinol dehydrogenase [Flavobacteriaceae bacterium]
MKVFKQPSEKVLKSILSRPTPSFQDIESTVTEMFLDIKRMGDTAINKYTSMFDGVELQQIKVSEAEITEASKSISPKLKTAIQQAKSNVEKFHRSQRMRSEKVAISEGVSCWQESRPIERVGLYIPGGTAPLFSSVIMLAVPAVLAGCEEIILCSPPSKSRNNTIAAEILYTAQLCGVKNIYKIGGIQAIAAMTFGTETIPSVYKIFGPGNQYVTVAKQMAMNYGVSIDMPAGPSELMVFSDDTGNPSYIAADLLSQAEHGTDSQVILVTTSDKLVEEVRNEINIQIDELPRKEIARKALENSKIIFVPGEKQALDIVNEYAPEHLIICSKNEDFFIKGLKNAGSVFLGNYTPESAGDYASGTNHTLPTNGFSRAYSGVNLDSFIKKITFQKLTREGLESIGDTIEIMAAAEGLDAHKNAVSIRLNG